MPKVSVITPVYNCEEFVKNSIFSILNQSFRDFELIIVDDCSTDNTFNIICSIKDDRIKLYKNDKNRGAAYSRNYAISKAQGKYIAFLDGDDIWCLDKLEKQIKFMESNNIDFSYTDYIEDEFGHKKFMLKGPNKVTHKLFMRFCFVGCLTVVYNREKFGPLSIPNTITKRNDYALWLKISEKFVCYRLAEPLSIYNKNEKSLSSGSKSKLIKFHFSLYKYLYNFSNFHCLLLTVRNVFYYFVKILLYRRKIHE